MVQLDELNNHECVKLVHELSVQEQYIYSRTTNA